MPTLTARGAATRARIIEGAAHELRQHGVAVTLDHIMAKTGTSKSQLFHYFPGGKEQLLLAVAEHEATCMLDDQQPFLSDLTNWEHWLAWRDAIVQRYRSQGGTCPLAVIMTEIGQSTPAARAITASLVEEWERGVAKGIRSMQDSGLVDRSIDVDRVARGIIAGIQGGVSIMLATGNVAYLEAALDAAINELRGFSIQA
ncbi:TetR/AcrR family transcriptional regulator [Saccharopolyspora sp. K220]|uniref:TetR/AcrR family transcriptional regulator n=1 Tax=Saccharopolyspora soli TaxID=2926618 RepID=UPI001F57F188|nr:TetR/AcrR family transcriptional regulator [Saccharopolyspora soli]MCI2424097.1 TetR/AcrR family transcriptional regulator [Saccharopolyspora soli]